MTLEPNMKINGFAELYGIVPTVNLAHPKSPPCFSNFFLIRILPICATDLTLISDLPYREPYIKGYFVFKANATILNMSYSPLPLTLFLPLYHHLPKKSLKPYSLGN